MLRLRTILFPGIDATFVLHEGGLVVRAAPTVHAQPYLESLAYRVDSEHGSIVFTGDTEPVESVIELARGADMMLCMCWDTDAAMKANGENGGMTGTTSAGLLAAQAGIRTLVLTHITARLDSPGVREEGIRDVAAVFAGEVVFGEELLALDVSRSHEATVL